MTGLVKEMREFLKSPNYNSPREQRRKAKSLIQRAIEQMEQMEWIPVDEFTWKHKDDDGLYALVYSVELDCHCAARWLGDNNWACLEGGELLEWYPTHAHLLEKLTPSDASSEDEE